MKHYQLSPTVRRGGFVLWNNIRCSQAAQSHWLLWACKCNLNDATAFWRTLGYGISIMINQSVMFWKYAKKLWPVM